MQLDVSDAPPTKLGATDVMETVGGTVLVTEAGCVGLAPQLAAAPEAAEAAPEAAEAAPEASDAVPEAPPGETELDIRFVIVPEGFSHTRRFALATTVAEVKAMCEEDLKIPVPNMKLVHAGEELFDGQTLESSGLKGGGLSQVELQIVYLEEHITPAPAYVMPDVVSVEVQFGADIPPKLIQVRQPALQSRPQPQSQPSRHRMHRLRP